MITDIAFHVKGAGPGARIFNENNMSRLRGNLGVNTCATHRRFEPKGRQPFHLTFPIGVALAQRQRHELHRAAPEALPLDQHATQFPPATSG
jgi:hypothetical protein